MKQLSLEIKANFDAFSSSWSTTVKTVTDDLLSEREKFLLSYRRMTSLQAWRSDFLDGKISDDSLAFFLEAQNDVLVSHVLARMGSWRSALKSLRSAIENVYFCLYYMDHPVELQLWNAGKHKLGFSEMHSYLQHHPRLASLEDSVTGLPILNDEYSILSKAVHGSAKSFRMTRDVSTTLLCSSKRSDLGAWTTRETHTITGLNLLLLSMFHDSLEGTRLPNLRKAISFAVPASTRTQIKTHLKVALFKP